MLDSSQLDIVNSEEKNILVVASPGSGKTSVIINRAGHIIREKKVDPKNIIIITFTKAAAENMKSRFKNLFSEEMLPFFGTFHSLFYHILYRTMGDINIISPSSAFYIVEKSLKTYMEEVSEERVKDVLNCISSYKTGFKEWQQLEEIISLNVLKQCYNNYESYKKKNGLLDFDDLQSKTLELFQKNTEMLNFYKSRFKYILVDEFQDCDMQQLNLLKLLCNGNSIFAVGDEDQCIYSFRGARPDFMVDFQMHFEGAVKKLLVRNYRSTYNIVETACRLIYNNKIRNFKEFAAANGNNGKIRCERYLDERTQGEEIALEIQRKMKEGKTDFRDFAVLYRTNIESKALVEAFIKRKIPFVMMDKNYCFYDHFICEDLLCYLRLSTDLTDREAFIRVINRPFRYISKINLDKLRTYPYKGDCIDILCGIPSLPFFQYKALLEFRRKLLQISRMPVKAIIDYMLMQLNYIEFIKSCCNKSGVNEDDLFSIVDEFKESLECFDSYLEFLEHVKIIREKLKVKKTEGQEGVIFSTIHGVKGMEFKNVFIINCVQGTIPFQREGKNSDIEEERRLFYVGITRAMENLYLTLPVYLKGKLCTESPFIKECGIQIIVESYNDYAIGTVVEHSDYGRGEVTDLSNGEIEIRFIRGKVRRFKMDVLLSHKLLKKLA